MLASKQIAGTKVILPVGHCVAKASPAVEGLARLSNHCLTTFSDFGDVFDPIACFAKCQFFLESAKRLLEACRGNLRRAEPLDGGPAFVNDAIHYLKSVAEPEINKIADSTLRR